MRWRERCKVEQDNTQRDEAHELLQQSEAFKLLLLLSLSCVTKPKFVN